MKNIVFLHGFGENASIWSEFTKLLNPQNQYHFPDFSEKKDCFSIPEYADWLKNYLDKKKINEAVIIGHSMGGYISVEFCHKYPEMVLGLGLFHSSVAADSEEKKENRDKTIQFLIKHDTNLFIKHFYPNMFTEEFKASNSDFIQKNIEEFSKIPNEALLASTLAMKSRQSHVENISDFKFPIFQILGQQDTFVNYKDALDQTVRMQRPNLLLMDNICHAGMFESPKICAQFINSFLSSF
ncbi:alpha/beta fold hydrolase [Lacihabitans soyangensis]|uniref:Alpha/beta hydrolase n=1 Tax=Lacihabitans soyangensis TaxID=869394 RepID=A0AAE3H7C7_9BACT|nr:alpha/beta hydrolase [Lacihabitans soyangensis]MCP9765331.1 alpha/beta hydrolase [Lacihabitans soyangensis]